MTDVDWRTQLDAAQQPSTPEQADWDADFPDIYDQGIKAGMSPGRAALRAMRINEARRGPRPEPKETQQ